MKMPKRLYYTPGLISLLGLLIALPYFYEANRPVKQGILPLFVPAECNENHGLNNYSECYLELLLRDKKQIRITINENHEENRKKLDVIRHEALKLKYFADTSTVILINLSDNISYGEFVSIVDMCETDGHKRYGSWDNKFVIWGEWPNKKVIRTNTITPLYCGTKPYKKLEQRPGVVDSLIEKGRKIYTPQGLCLIVGLIALTISYFVKIRLTGINTAEILNSPSSSTL